MFLETLEITFSATLQVLLLGAAGFWAVRGKMLNETGLDQLTAVLVNILLPCFAFIQLAGHFNFQEFSIWWQLPVLYVVMAIAALAVAYVTGFGFKGSRKNQFLALVGFQNCGNIPLVVVAAMFQGQSAHTLFVYIVLFIIGANLLIWTLGVWLLVSGEKKSIDLKKLINPPLITTLLTILLVAIHGERFIPKTVIKPIEMLGNCALPIAMFTVGGGLASLNLRRIEVGPSLLIVFSKLILFPALALTFVIVFKVDFLMGFLIVLEAAVPSAVTLSIISRYYNLDEELVNEGVFVTHLASILTIPIFLTLYMKLAGQF